MMRRTMGIGSVVSAAAMLLALAPRSAEAQSGTYLEIVTQGNGPEQTIKLALGPDRMRLDAAEGVSVVSIGGENAKILMIQHTEKRYIEFTAQMMAAMSGLIGQMPPEVEERARDMTPPKFTRTGNTKRVGEWNAYEVRVEQPGQEGEMIMWLSPDVDADFRALARQVIDSMSSLLNNPMMRNMSGGPSGLLGQIEAQISSMEMPDGFPVQIISTAGGTQTTNTLLAIDQNANFDAATWEPPAGYQKMDMPFIR